MDQILTEEQLRILGFVADHRFADGSAAVSVKVIVNRALWASREIAEIDDALDNGADEHIWPPGLSRAQAIEQLTEDRGAEELRAMLRRALPLLFTHPFARKVRKHFGEGPTKNELARRALRADIELELKKNGAEDDKSPRP